MSKWPNSFPPSRDMRDWRTGYQIEAWLANDGGWRPQTVSYWSRRYGLFGERVRGFRPRRRERKAAQIRLRPFLFWPDRSGTFRNYTWQRDRLSAMRNPKRWALVRAARLSRGFRAPDWVHPRLSGPQRSEVSPTPAAEMHDPKRTEIIHRGLAGR